MPDTPTTHQPALRVTGVQRAQNSPTLIITLNRPASLEEAADLLGPLKRHLNGDGTRQDADDTEITAGRAAMDDHRISQHAARQMLLALQNLRMRFHACCIASGSDAWVADAACERADAAIAAAEGR